MTEIILPNGVKFIGSSAFSGCTGLTEIKIPKCVTDIVYGAFSGWTNNQTIYYPKDSGFESILNWGNEARLIPYDTGDEQNGGDNTGQTSDAGDEQNDSDNTEQTSDAGSEQSNGDNTGQTSDAGDEQNGSDNTDQISDAGDEQNDSDNTDQTSDAGDGNKCGENVTWILDRRKITISGKGDMYNYSPDQRPPWYDERSKIKRVFIDKGVTSIGDYAFAYCENLEKVVHYVPLEKISKSAFKNCPNLKIHYKEELKRVTVNGNYKGEAAAVIGGTVYLRKEITINGSSDKKYEKFFLLISDKKVDREIIKKVPSAAKVVIVVDPGLKEIKDECFEDCTGFEHVKVYSHVERIGKRAFKDCVNMISIRLPAGLKEIDDGAFENCTSLKETTIPKEVTELSDDIFSGCKNLAEVKILGNVERIGKHAFKDCEKLKSIELPASLKEIDDGAFENCTSLKEITIPDSVTSIGKEAFSGWTNNQTIYYPKDSGFEGILRYANSAKLIPYPDEREVWDFLPTLDELNDVEIEDKIIPPKKLIEDERDDIIPLKKDVRPKVSVEKSSTFSDKVKSIVRALKKFGKKIFGSS